MNSLPLTTDTSAVAVVCRATADSLTAGQLAACVRALVRSTSSVAPHNGPTVASAGSRPGSVHTRAIFAICADGSMTMLMASLAALQACGHDRRLVALVHPAEWQAAQIHFGSRALSHTLACRLVAAGLADGTHATLVHNGADGCHDDCGHSFATYTPSQLLAAVSDLLLADLLGTGRQQSGSPTPVALAPLEAVAKSLQMLATGCTYEAAAGAEGGPSADRPLWKSLFTATDGSMRADPHANHSLPAHLPLQTGRRSLPDSRCFGPLLDLPFETVHGGFELRAKRHPDWTAVEIGSRQSLTYGELDSLGTALAGRIASLGVCIGSRVAVVMQRCLEWPLALLAVLKTGATIVPLDSRDPADYIRFVVEDAGVSIVLSAEAERGRLDALRLPASVHTVSVSKSDLAVAVMHDAVDFCGTHDLHAAIRTDEFMIVYTDRPTAVSASTASTKPKGVVLTHGGVANVVGNSSTQLGCSDRVRMAQLMDIGSDGSQIEMWGSLCNGGTLVLPDVVYSNSDATAPVASAASVSRMVDAIIVTPSRLAQLGDPAGFPCLKHVTVTVANEPCPAALMDLWASRLATFTVAYGHAETSTVALAATLAVGDHATIGSAAPNTACYILDDTQQPVAFGAVGSVYIGGIGVSTGYTNLPEQTAEVFMADPFAAGEFGMHGGRMFKTGDVGRMLPDGRVEILSGAAVPSTAAPTASAAAAATVALNDATEVATHIHTAIAAVEHDDDDVSRGSTVIDNGQQGEGDVAGCAAVFFKTDNDGSCLTDATAIPSVLDTACIVSNGAVIHKQESVVAAVAVAVAIPADASLSDTSSDITSDLLSDLASSPEPIMDLDGAEQMRA